MRTNKKYEALNALADIRDWVREHASTDAAKYMPEALRKKFNLVAKRLGASEPETWCVR